MNRAFGLGGRLDCLSFVVGTLLELLQPRRLRVVVPTGDGVGIEVRRIAVLVLDARDTAVTYRSGGPHYIHSAILATI